MGRKVLFKVVSLLVVSSFIMTSTVIAAPVVKEFDPSQELVAGVFKAKVSPYRDAYTLDTANFEIPSGTGTVKEVWVPRDAQKLIVHIQDAHTNYSAHKNIAKITEHLATKYDLRSVMIEAGFQKDYSLVNLRDRYVVDQLPVAGDKLLNKAEIKGDQFVTLTHDFDLELWGVEDRKLYDQEIQSYVDAEGSRSQAKASLDKISSQVNIKKNQIFPAQLAELEKAKSSYDNKEIRLRDYMAALEKAGTDITKLSDYNILGAYNTVLIKEDKVDFGKVSVEKDAILDRLVNNTAIQAANDAFLMGEISQAEFYGKLAEKADKATETNVITYADYLKDYNKLDITKLFDDVDKMEARIKAKLITTDEQKKIDRIAKRVDFLKNFVDLRVTSDEYDDFLKDKANYKVSSWLDVLPATLSADAGKVDIITPKLDKFYQIARARDNSLVSNSIQRMDEKGINIAAMRVGGFHTPSLTKLFKQNKIGYIVITPNVTGDTDTAFYLETLKKAWKPETLSQVDSEAPEPGDVTPPADTPPEAAAPSEGHRKALIDLYAMAGSANSEIDGNELFMKIAANPVMGSILDNGNLAVTHPDNESLDWIEDLAKVIAQAANNVSSDDKNLIKSIMTVTRSRQSAAHEIAQYVKTGTSIKKALYDSYARHEIGENSYLNTLKNNPGLLGGVSAILEGVNLATHGETKYFVAAVNAATQKALNRDATAEEIKVGVLAHLLITAEEQQDFDDDEKEVLALAARSKAIADFDGEAAIALAVQDKPDNVELATEVDLGKAIAGFTASALSDTPAPAAGEAVATLTNEKVAELTEGAEVYARVGAAVNALFEAQNNTAASLINDESREIVITGKAFAARAGLGNNSGLSGNAITVVVGDDKEEKVVNAIISQTGITGATVVVGALDVTIGEKAGQASDAVIVISEVADWGEEAPEAIENTHIVVCPKLAADVVLTLPAAIQAGIDRDEAVIIGALLNDYLLPVAAEQLATIQAYVDAAIEYISSL